MDGTVLAPSLPNGITQDEVDAIAGEIAAAAAAVTGAAIGIEQHFQGDMRATALVLCEAIDNYLHEVEMQCGLDVAQMIAVAMATRISKYQVEGEADPQ